MGWRRVTHYQSAVSFGIAQAVFDIASGIPGPIGTAPAMQAVVRPGNKKPLVRWRLKRKIKYAGNNRNQDYTKDKYPEMPITQAQPFICPGWSARNNDMILPVVGFPCHCFDLSGLL